MFSKKLDYFGLQSRWNFLDLVHLNVCLANYFPCIQTFYDIVSRDFYNAGGTPCTSLIRKSWAIISEYGRSGDFLMWNFSMYRISLKARHCVRFPTATRSKKGSPDR